MRSPTLVPVALLLGLLPPAAARASSAAAPAAAPRLVLKSGRALAVRSFEVDGAVVRIVGASGEPYVIGAELVDLEASRGGAGAAPSSRELPAEAAPVAGAPADASAEGPETLLVFTAAWCSPCQRLKQKALPHPRVRKALSRYRFRLVDFDVETELVEKYRVLGVPSYVVVDGQGEVRRTGRGYWSPASFAEWLEQEPERP